MGNRQSSQQESQDANQNNNNNNNVNNNDIPSNERGRTMRPPSRLQAQRQTLRSAVIPVNDNQRRDERRARRERLREQQLNGTEEENEHDEEEEARGRNLIAEAMTVAAALRNTTTTNTSDSTSPNTETNISPFSRMIASVISEAVITSFRNGHIPTVTPSTTTPTTPTATANTTTATATNTRQQLTMHLSPEVFQQMEPRSTENSFMRFMRLPVIVTSVSTPAAGTTTTTAAAAAEENQPQETTTTTTAVNADGQAPTLSTEESEVTRIIMLPVFLYGIRSSVTQSDNTTATPTLPTQATTVVEEEDTQPIRRSERIRAATEAQAQQAQQQTANRNNQRLTNGQWTVYIISGPNVDGIMSDNASYEELLDLDSIIGPARLPTVSQEAIDEHVPRVKYHQVKQTIVGNSEGCQICLTSYQSEDDLRILACHHGFHDDCICKWLTQGRNQCPLCRSVPIPTT